jgi:hypothetical protein
MYKMVTNKVEPKFADCVGGIEDYVSPETKELQKLNSLLDSLSNRLVIQGCICPPTSEKTCQAISCPRRNHLA